MTAMEKTETFWNGMPTPARRGTAVVADAPEFPMYWARDLVGQRIAVVEVVLDGVNYGGGIDYLDDRHGQGWAKVTEGHGSPRYGHASAAIEPGSFVVTEDRSRSHCRECQEGKHGACNGTALVDDGFDVVEVDCICASQSHGGA